MAYAHRYYLSDSMWIVGYLSQDSYTVNIEFVNLVEKMRQAQDGFFKADKNSSARVVFLKESKAYEKMVDDKIKEFKSTQIDLFKS